MKVGLKRRNAVFSKSQYIESRFQQSSMYHNNTCHFVINVSCDLFTIWPLHVKTQASENTEPEPSPLNLRISCCYEVITGIVVNVWLAWKSSAELLLFVHVLSRESTNMLWRMWRSAGPRWRSTVDPCTSLRAPWWMAWRWWGTSLELARCSCRRWVGFSSRLYCCVG